MFSVYSRFVRIVCTRYKLAQKNSGFTVLYISRHSTSVTIILYFQSFSEA